jgi:hypothetical protein
VLPKQGWTFVGEHKLDDWGRDLGGIEYHFRNGSYSLDLTYAGEKANYGWEYAIGIEWNAP